MAVSANRLELLSIADAVAREKAIDKEIVIEAMEDAIQKAARSRYGAENEIRAQIDRDNGDIRLFRIMEVVEDVENAATEVSLKDARLEKPEAEIGEFLADPLPPVEFGRIAAQTAKQVIVQKVRDAERERQYEEYKDRVGDVVTGVVKRVEYGNAIVDLGRAEAIMRRDQSLPREHLRTNDRIRAFIRDVRREARGPQIFLSRTEPKFMASLFSQEVPEIYDGVIEIKSVARDPGSRAKIAVLSYDASIDPVGACVGMRGSRVQAVVSELQGEKIDIIQWNDDAATFIVNALAPAEVVKVVLDEDSKRIEVVVPDDQLSLAIGRRGQNVRLASQLTGWTIDILTEAEESERRQEEFVSRSTMFAETLDVDETMAQLLVVEGFSELEEVAFVESGELISIEGFDESLVGELQQRALDALESRERADDDKRRELGVSDDIAEIEGMTPKMMIMLGEGGIRTLEGFAGLIPDELVSGDGEEFKGLKIPTDEASAMIMLGRVKIGWIDEIPEEPAPEEPAEEESEADAGAVDADEVFAKGTATSTEADGEESGKEDDPEDDPEDAGEDKSEDKGEDKGEDGGKDKEEDGKS
ncbi:MAG: transcription termination/antitermination protein NusA [Proteobacteria bacterium]|nr:transcription termination/antitermination protein NusA [Pseudomonadota bacterium]